MHILLILSGVALLGFTALDVLWTTLAVGSGGGPLTSRLCSVLWKVVSTVSDEDFQAALSKLDKRRRLLLALIKSDGWPWETVVNPYR